MKEGRKGLWKGVRKGYARKEERKGCEGEKGRKEGRGGRTEGRKEGM